MTRTFLLFILIVGVFFSSAAQERVRDTSFSVYSTFIKTRKNHPEISIASPPLSATVKVKTGLVYQKVNGRRLELDVFFPKERSKSGYPAVLMIHGGGWRSGDRSHNTPTAKVLAENGYVAVSVEYRLSTEATYPAAVHDLKTAIRWIRANARKYNIDTSKVATWGCSAGGQLAALLGTTAGNARLEGQGGYTKHSSAVQAIVDVDGTLAFIHPESGEGNDSQGTSAATYWFGFPKTERPDLWYEAAPLSHVSSKTPPILFINSSVDRMHAGRDDMIRKLNSWNIYSEVHTFKDAPHPFWLFNPWFQPTVSHTLNFLNKVFQHNQN
ncbi:alpha/beta hydrolase fold domain-containing protein [Paradesertivirga mongoliensis]|uniref:Alpha/beta hydrolase fold domain-containing protein n=1 Tax=Paradesertivirga mongoliensis TaxID=2100740 RepID=A0ABW4ZGY7_9SPHI|nr:alpha/beta hydrolase [Pedobacter mongoliensis]